MGANAATQAYQVLENLKRILAIELFNAAQAIEFQGVDKTSPKLQRLHRQFRTEVPFVEVDVEMHVLMNESVEFIRQHRASEI
jgi:histidine ammonia-lyase